MRLPARAEAAPCAASALALAALLLWGPPEARFPAERSVAVYDRRGELLGASVSPGGFWRFPEERLLTAEIVQWAPVDWILPPKTETDDVVPLTTDLLAANVREREILDAESLPVSVKISGIRSLRQRLDFSEQVCCVFIRSRRLDHAAKISSERTNRLEYPVEVVQQHIDLSDIQSIAHATMAIKIDEQ